MKTAWLLMFSLTALMLCGQEGHVHSSREGARLLPLPKGDDVWHFVIFGDRTTGRPEGLKILDQAVSDTNLLDPDLVMTVGDMVQGYNAQEQWLAEMREYKGIMDRLKRPWYPVPGNHDVYWRGPEKPAGEHEKNYEEHFGPLWYWFRHKSAAFITLYSDEGDLVTGEKQFGRHDKFSEAQLAWLEKTLQATRSQKHVFVFLHHPRWVTSKYPSANWDRAHALLAAAGNVKAVFAGHIHQMRYDGLRDGIEYFALAATGGNLALDLPAAGYLHHFNVVTVRDQGFNVAAIPVGAVIDPRQFTPERIADIDALRTLAAPKVLRPIEVSLTSGAIDGIYAIEFRNPTKRPIECTFTARLPDNSWSISPDHSHMVVEPEGTTSVKFVVRRSGESPPQTFPTLGVQVDWLGPDVRISMPEKLYDTQIAVVDLSEIERPNLAAQLNGKNGCLRVPIAPDLIPDSPFTVEGWVNADSLSGRRPLISKAESSDFGLFFSDGKPTFSVHLNGAYVVAAASAPIVTTGTWHHLAGVYDGQRVRLFVDGKLAAEKAGTGSRKRNTLPLYVGADTNAQGAAVDPIIGLVDEIRISRGARYTGPFSPMRRLTADETTVLYLSFDVALGRYHPDQSAARTSAEQVGGVRLVPVEK